MAARFGLQAMMDAMDAAMRAKPLSEVGGDLRALIRPSTQGLAKRTLSATAQRNDPLLQAATEHGLLSHTMGGEDINTPVTNAFLYFNRALDNPFRRAAFVSKLDGTIQRNFPGETLRSLDEKGLTGQIPEQLINDAVDYAHKVSFSDNPSTEFGRLIVSLSKYPGADLLTGPFGRYTVSAAKYAYDTSPLALLKLVKARSGEDIAKSISGTTVGLGKLALANEIRNSDLGGDNYWELNAGGKTIDLRVYAPMLIPELFVTEMIKRVGNGTIANNPPQLKDFASGLLGITSRGGMGIASVDDFVSALSSTDESGWHKFLSSVGSIAGIYPQRLTTPGAAVRDIAGGAAEAASPLFDKWQAMMDNLTEFAKERNTKRDVTTPQQLLPDQFAADNPKIAAVAKAASPAIMPAMANIPGLDQMLLPQRTSTSAEPGRRETPLADEPFGLKIIQPHNEVEKEISRLNLSPPNPTLGDPQLNYWAKEEIGPMTEMLGRAVISSPAYQKAGPAVRSAILGAALSLAKQAGTAIATARHPEFADKQVGGVLTQPQQNLLKEVLGKDATEQLMQAIKTLGSVQTLNRG